MTDTDYHIDLMARVCHEANRALQVAFGEVPSPAWDDLDAETKDSATNGVDYAWMTGGSPRQSHENWLRFKAAHGWVYGPEKDPEAKTHPCMVDYDDLPPEQRVKDDVFVAIVDALS